MERSIGEKGQFRPACERGAGRTRLEDEYSVGCRSASRTSRVSARRTTSWRTDFTGCRLPISPFSAPTDTHAPMRRNLCSVAVLVAAVSTNAHAQGASRAALVARIDSIMQAPINAKQVVG